MRTVKDNEGVTAWCNEWRREWEKITGELKKYNLNHILLISSEMTDVRREKEINGKN